MQSAVQAATAPGTWIYNVIYTVMVIFFAFFYTDIMFNPVDMSDNLKKQGGFVPASALERPRPSTSTGCSSAPRPAVRSIWRWCVWFRLRSPSGSQA